ncbi:MAG: hypothetical protein ACI9G1_001122 [Pirellulaceae bacterium]|jgi:hypothetical protein
MTTSHLMAGLVKPQMLVLKNGLAKEEKTNGRLSLREIAS